MFSYNPTKIGKNCVKIVSMTPADTHLPGFQGARLDHVPVESSSPYFPRKLASRKTNLSWEVYQRKLLEKMLENKRKRYPDLNLSPG